MITAIRLIFISVASMFLLSACGGDNGNNSVSYEDPNLEVCINEAISNSGGDVAQDLTDLDCGDKKIKSINGLEKLTHLTNLDLNNISALAALVNLEYLYQITTTPTLVHLMT